MDNNSGKNIFDVKAATWDENPRRVARAAEVARKIKEALRLDKTMSALDFGCGTGLVSVLLAGSVKSITAVDTSEQMLKVLADKLTKNKVSNITTKKADLTKENPFTEKFDLVFSSMAFHHIERPSALLKRLFELLRGGGYVAICDLDKEDGSFHSDIKAVHNGFVREEFVSWLEEAGFSEIKAQTAVNISKPDAQNIVRKYSVFLITGRKPE
jgi:tRNA (cmo5U34)-methyltransferase